MCVTCIIYILFVRWKCVISATLLCSYVRSLHFLPRLYFFSLSFPPFLSFFYTRERDWRRPYESRVLCVMMAASLCADPTLRAHIVQLCLAVSPLKPQRLEINLWHNALRFTEREREPRAAPSLPQRGPVALPKGFCGVAPPRPGNTKGTRAGGEASPSAAIMGMVME